MAEILASLDDINANLDGTVVKAEDTNTALLQISVARIVRGYLSRVVPVTNLAGWDEPANTPEIVREAAGKLIASQLYFNQASSTSSTIDERNFAQILYDKAIEILRGIVDGTVILDIVFDPVEGLSNLDFFPVDDTDRAFTMSMEL